MNQNDNISGIYAILNIANDKFYIGSAVSISNRWYDHQRKLRYSKHDNRHLQRAYTKHGADVFIYTILEYVSDTADLIAREQFWLDTLQPYNNKIGYNNRPTASSMIGYKHTEQTLAKFKQKIYSAETIAKMSAARKGTKMPQQVKEKMIATQKLKRNSEETKQKMRLAWVKRKQIILSADCEIKL